MEAGQGRQHTFWASTKSERPIPGPLVVFGFFGWGIPFQRREMAGEGGRKEMMQGIGDEEARLYTQGSTSKGNKKAP